MIDALLDAVAEAAWPRALELALGAWRETRAPALADLIDAISARCERLPRPNRYLQPWWLEAAKTYDPVTAATLLDRVHERAHKGDSKQPLVDPVLARLGRDLPVHQRNRIERFALLEKWPDDPRVATVLARWFVHDCFNWSAPHAATVSVFVEMLGEELARHADARVVAELETCVERPRARTYVLRRQQRTLAPEIIRAIHAQVRRLPATDEARIVAATRSLAPPPPPPRPDTRPLWDAIARDPDALAPRLVLADALLDAGDSRGELIALQCSDAPEAERLADQLIARDWNTWFGDLALVLDRGRSRFVRGVLEHAAIGLEGSPDWAYEAVGDHRELCAVRSIVATVAARPAPFAAFLRSLANVPPRLVLTPTLLDALDETRLAFEILDVDSWRSNDVPFERVIGQVLAAFPALEVVKLQISDFPLDFTENVKRLATHRTLRRVEIQTWRSDSWIHRSLELLVEQMPMVELVR